MDLYSNAIIIPKKLAKEKPEVVKGFLRALNKGMLDSIKGPEASWQLSPSARAAVKVPLERERSDATFADEMNHPEIKKIGLGNVDEDRLKRSISIMVDAHPAAAHADRCGNLDHKFLPRNPNCRRSCSNARHGAPPVIGGASLPSSFLPKKHRDEISISKTKSA